MGKFPMLLGFIQAFLPIVLHGVETGVWFGVHAHEIAFNACNLLLATMFGGMILSFTHVGILDFRRRFRLQKSLISLTTRTTELSAETIFDEDYERESRLSVASTSSMDANDIISVLPYPTAPATDETRPAGRTASSKAKKEFQAVAEASAQVPLISLDSMHNVATWLLVRRLLKKLGQRYWSRVQIAMAQLALASIFMLLFLVLDLIGSSVVTLGTTQRVALLVYSFFSISMLTVAVASGAKNNTQHHSHMALLNEESGKLAYPIAQCKFGGHKRRLAQYEAAEHMLRYGVSSVALDADLEPVRILGIRASFMIFRTAIVLVFSLLSFLLRLLF